MNKKALVAMSGGVDSSVAAYLTQQAGFDCIGVTMKLFHNEDVGASPAKSCCSLDDVEDARAVSLRLGIPHYVFNFKEDFRAQVMEKFARGYENGLTPNPCIDCNRYLKFGKLYQRAQVLGRDCVVTGHYARIERRGDRYLLKKALDETKDQSYVLYFLTQEQLAHVRFPLGTLTKADVRAIAEGQGFYNARKPDSQDICFVPDGDHAGAVQRMTGRAARPGDLVGTNGAVLGRHRGIVHYTIGQRRGLGVSASQRLYVCGISPKENTVTLGRERELLRCDAWVNALHWISGRAPDKPVSCKVKTQYRQAEQPAVVTPMGTDRARIRFDRPQRAVAPGQAAVFYEGDVVLGGGVLAE